MVAPTFGLPGPPPLAAPAVFAARPLTSPSDDARLRPGGDDPVPGSVRILSTALAAARFEVAAQF
jgi:hypothetical protein